MSAYFGELLNRATLIGDITHKLRYAITNTAYLTGGNIIFERETVVNDSPISLCNGLPSDMSLSSLAGGNIASIPGGPAGTGGLSGTPIASEVLNLVRAWMATYAKVQKIQIIDNATRTTTPVVIMAPLTNANTTVVGQVNSAVAAASAGISPGLPVTATSVNNFINQCQAIWKTYCLDGAAKLTYYVSYCHSNHCSHSNHGSRGRR